MTGPADLSIRPENALAGQPVIVGSGIAGLMAALALAPRPAVLLTRAGLGEETSTGLAQGGIAAAIGPDDGLEAHLADTIAAGDGLVDAARAADILADTAAIIALLEGYGVGFDRAADGSRLFGLEAAHGRRRILHAGGDASGAAIARALTAAVRRCPSITCLEGCSALQLVVSGGRVAGLVCEGPGGVFLLPTPAVVLATGGIGGLYAEATAPPANWGAGLALAAEAGALLADMEFVQFHPTALARAGRPKLLISEAVRGEGARLVDAAGRPIMAGEAGGDLAPRDRVARKVAAAAAAGGAFLDAREARVPGFAARFPGIDAGCRAHGIDPARDVIPVAPAAHYHMGGIAVDGRGRSSLPGLRAAGECACTGLHGANRLASNSLLEAAILGHRAGRDLATRPLPALPAVTEPPASPPPQGPCDAGPVQAIVSASLGVTRDGDGLAAAVQELLALVQAGGPSRGPAVVGLMMAVAAEARRESRGAHARRDYPGTAAPAGRRSRSLPEAIAAAERLAGLAPPLPLAVRSIR